MGVRRLDHDGKREKANAKWASVPGHNLEKLAPEKPTSEKPAEASFSDVKRMQEKKP